MLSLSLDTAGKGGGLGGWVGGSRGGRTSTSAHRQTLEPLGWRWSHCHSAGTRLPPRHTRLGQDSRNDTLLGDETLSAHTRRDHRRRISHCRGTSRVRRRPPLGPTAGIPPPYGGGLPSAPPRGGGYLDFQVALPGASRPGEQDFGIPRSNDLYFRNRSIDMIPVQIATLFPVT